MLKELMTPLINKKLLVLFGDCSSQGILTDVRNKKVTGWVLAPEKRVVDGKNKTPTCIELVFSEFTLTFVEDDFEYVVSDGIKVLSDGELVCTLLPQLNN